MLDLDFSLWVVILVFAIIVLRPKDWIHIMTKVGQYYSTFNSYKNEWVDYIEFSTRKKQKELFQHQIERTLTLYHPELFVMNQPILFSRHEISVTLKK